MNLFLTKVRNWDVPVGPMQFRTNGLRENAIQQLSKGDRVVLVGTMSDGVPENMKGRLLGVMEPSREPVMSLDFAMPKRPEDFKGEEYKWPWGLMNFRAWSLPQRPKLKDISEREFGMFSTQGIVSLDSEEAARVLALEWREEELLKPTAQASRRMEKKHGHGVSKRSSPPPTTTRRGVMHMRGAPAYTYAMKIIGASPDAIKIGWAFDYKSRARQFNRGAMPGLGGLKYNPIRFHLWDTARQAYAMEQKLLAGWDDRLHPDNREIVLGLSDDDLGAAWQAFIIDNLRQS